MLDKISELFKRLGPGFITGSADDDPSGIGTYSQTGTIFGFTQLWVALFSFPFMTVVQEICGRIGVVTGKGLASNIKQHYSKKILYACVSILVIANIVNIGADLGAMASTAQLLLGLPFSIWLILITLVCVLLQVYVPYKSYTKYLKYFGFSLLAYVLTAFVIHEDWGKILQNTFIPTFSLDKSFILNIVAILGTTISPYLFFWQANEEVEEEVAHKQLRIMGIGRPKFGIKDLKLMRNDTIVGMFFSNAIMFFIIITTASTLATNGITQVDTATQAAEALRPIAGNFAYLLFAFGIIGTGLLAIPVLAGSSAYALSETFNFKEGLYKKFKNAHAFYGIIGVSTLIGLIINYTPIPPFQLLYYTAILNGICAPPLLIIIMLISNNKKIMGNYVNNKFSNILGWSITGIMTICTIVIIINSFTQ